MKHCLTQASIPLTYSRLDLPTRLPKDFPFFFQLRGSNTGVFVGACFSDYFSLVTEDINKVCGYENTGAQLSSNIASRISSSFICTPSSPPPRPAPPFFRLRHVNDVQSSLVFV